MPAVEINIFTVFLCCVFVMLPDISYSLVISEYAAVCTAFYSPVSIICSEFLVTSDEEIKHDTRGVLLI